MSSRHTRTCTAWMAGVAVFAWAAAAAADPLRIVTYNIEADIGGYTTSRPGMSTVLQGIGNENVNGDARPLDILALQETTSNTTTVDPMVSMLDALYGAGTYARSPYQATQNGSPSSGNGPNAVIYNAATLQLVASVGIGTPSSSGPPRQPVRYQFRPVGGTSAGDFYIYVSHFKAGTSTTDKNRRNIEAQLLRSDALTLPASARIIYSGDFNTDSSSDACYQTFTAAGQGQAFDPPNRPGDWALNPNFVDVLTESATNLRYRDDFLLVTQNIMTDASGLHYTAGSYHTFGINGSIAVHGTVDSAANTALPGLPNRAAVLAALTTASDHLPVIADFDLPLGTPTISLSLALLDRTSWRGNNLPADTFEISNTGQGALNYAITASAPWLSVSPDNGVSTGQADLITITYAATALADGDHTATITATDSAATNSPQTITVTLHVYTPGDFDHDADVDQSDFGFLQTCFTTAGQPPTDLCRPADLNLDGEIDAADLSVFTSCCTGNGLAPGC
jgi:endonuclease/exonuclease/phosphatase family metal-dependent hydrolase